MLHEQHVHCAWGMAGLPAKFADEKLSLSAACNLCMFTVTARYFAAVMQSGLHCSPANIVVAKGLGSTAHAYVARRDCCAPARVYLREPHE